MSIYDVIRGEVERAQRKLAAVVRRGVLSVVSDAYFCQVEALGDERFDDVELWQVYGVSSRPPAGGEVILVKVGGRGEGAVAISGTDRAHRPGSLASGDSVLYASAASGDQAKVHCKADGDVDLTAKSGKTVNVGGDATACVDFLLKGTAFNSTHDTMLTAIQGAFTALAAEAALTSGTTYTAAATAIGTYKTAASGLLAANAKVK